MKTLSHVPIMNTGEYEISTGMTTFSLKHLASAKAAIGQPGIVAPRLAIGHKDGRFDGEPAFGIFQNMSLEAGGHELYADICGVPDWLAEVSPYAFPNRSVEGRFNFAPIVGAKKHDFVITRVSLLGVVLPGISTLEDLETALTGTPEYELLDDPEEMYASAGAVAIFLNGEPMGKQSVAASISVDDVRRAFYTQVSTGDHSQWWAGEIQIDPQQVIVNDDESGDTYRIPYAAGSDGKVEFADAVKVETQYVDIAASSRTAHKPIKAKKGTVYANAAESRSEGDQMTPEEIRASVGLAEDATDAQLKARLAKLNAESPADEDEDGENEDGEEDDETDEVDEETTAASVPTNKKTVKVAKGTKQRVVKAAASASNTGETVTVDKEQFERLTSQVTVLAARHEQDEKGRRLEVVRDAIKAGKIPPARKDHWVAAMNADPEGTEETLKTLASILPLGEIGNGTHDADENTDVAASGYDPILLSVGERARVAANTEGYDPHLKVGAVQMGV